MKKMVAVLTIAIACSPAFAQMKSHGHDGIWWRTKSTDFREAFIIGYRAGAAHERGSYSYLGGHSAMQLVDGVNHFYGNFRNTNIQFDDAMAYVKDELAGASSEALASELQTMREKATAPRAGDEN